MTKSAFEKRPVKRGQNCPHHLLLFLVRKKVYASLEPQMILKQEFIKWQGAFHGSFWYFFFLYNHWHCGHQ